MQPQMDLDRQWRDCCCHVRQSMSVASALMIVGAIILAVYGVMYNLRYATGSIPWFIGSFCAMAAVHRVQPNLLTVTVVVVLLNFVGAVIAISFLLVEWVEIMKTASLSDHVRSAMIPPTILASAFLILDIWILHVSVKCRQYLCAKIAWIIRNSAPQICEIKTVTLP